MSFLQRIMIFCTLLMGAFSQPALASFLPENILSTIEELKKDKSFPVDLLTETFATHGTPNIFFDYDENRYCHTFNNPYSHEDLLTKLIWMVYSIINDDEGGWCYNFESTKNIKDPGEVPYNSIGHIFYLCQNEIQDQLCLFDQGSGFIDQDGFFITTASSLSSASSVISYFLVTGISFESPECLRIYNVHPSHGRTHPQYEGEKEFNLAILQVTTPIAPQSLFHLVNSTEKDFCDTSGAWKTSGYPVEAFERTKFRKLYDYTVSIKESSDHPNYLILSPITMALLRTGGQPIYKQTEEGLFEVIGIRQHGRVKENGTWTPSALPLTQSILEWVSLAKKELKDQE